jgi:hypothetical protein
MPGRPRLLSIAGWALTATVIVFMLWDVSFDLRQAPLAIQANAGLGVPADIVLTIGITGLVCTLLYAIPQTALLGAVLLTGFFGGAVVTHMRVHGSMHDIGENLLLGLLAWAGLWLRDARLRALLPLRRSHA